MNSKIWLLILGISLSPVILSRPAGAQCVQSHVGVQLDISKNQNTRQNNDIEMNSNPSCSGNSSSSTSTQRNIGGDGATQNQRVRHSNSSSLPNPSGVNAPTIQNRVVIPVPVETPDTPINFP
jgi:hypothetical protein